MVGYRYPQYFFWLDSIYKVLRQKKCDRCCCYQQSTPQKTNSLCLKFLFILQRPGNYPFQTLIDVGFDDACLRRKNGTCLEPRFIEHSESIQAAFVVSRYVRVDIASNQEVSIITNLIKVTSHSNGQQKDQYRAMIECLNISDAPRCIDLRVKHEIWEDR